MPICTEITATWLPESLVERDQGRRLEFIVNGVWWEEVWPPEDGENAQPDREWFLPWKWEDVEHFVQYDSTGSPNGIGTKATPVEQNTTDYAAIGSKYAATYESEITNVQLSEIAPSLFGGDHGEFKVPVSKEDETQRRMESIPKGGLRAFLAEKAISTPPINHCLKMAWVSNSTNPPGSDGNEPSPTYWVPHFKGDQRPTVEKIQVEGAEVLKATFKSFFRGENSLVIYIRQAEQHSSLGLFAPKWISDTEEWLSTFNHKAAQLFDLSDWIVQWVDSTESTSLEVLTACRDAIMNASLRSLWMATEKTDNWSCHLLVDVVWSRKPDDQEWANDTKLDQESFRRVFSDAKPPDTGAMFDLPETKDWKLETKEAWLSGARLFLATVRSPETAKRIILDLWNDVTFPKETRESVIAVLSGILKEQATDLRMWSLDGERQSWLADPFAGTSTSSERETVIAKNVAHALKEMCAERVKTYPIVAGLSEWLQGQETQIENSLFPTTEKAYPAPLPLRIGVDTLASQGNMPDDLNDLDSGILLVVEGGDKVCCLNDVCHPDYPNVRFFVPSPVVEQDGLRMAEKLLSNENPSLIVSSELIEKNTGADNIPSGGLHWKFPDSAAYKYPTLIYGKDYLFWCARVTNGGVLPSALRNAGEGDLVVPTTDLKKPSQGGLSFKHQRRSLIGPIRFCDQSGTPQTSSPFKIPSPKIPPTLLDPEKKTAYVRDRRIEPLAAELPQWQQDGANNEISVGSDADGKNLLILFPENGDRSDPNDDCHRGTATFHVCKPSCTVWDWIAWEQQKVEAITDALDLDVAARDSDGSERFQPQIDPAVSDFAWVEIKEVWPKSKKVNEISVQYWSGAIAVTVKRGATPSQPLLAQSGAEVIICATEDTIFRLRIHSLVAKKEFEEKGKFHNFMRHHASLVQSATPGKQAEPKEIEGEFYAFAPIEIWIEVPPQWSTEKLSAAPPYSLTFEDASDLNKTLSVENVAKRVTLSIDSTQFSAAPWCKSSGMVGKQTQTKRSRMCSTRTMPRSGSPLVLVTVRIPRARRRP
jgi:hypothetical protein